MSAFCRVLVRFGTLGSGSPSFCVLGVQHTEIGTRRILIDTQIKFRHHGEDMVKNIRLDGLVIRPNLVFAENVNFDRQAVFGLW